MYTVTVTPIVFETLFSCECLQLISPEDRLCDSFVTHMSCDNDVLLNFYSCLKPIDCAKTIKVRLHAIFDIGVMSIVHK